MIAKFNKHLEEYYKLEQKFKDEVKKLIKEIENDLMPKTLF